MSVYAESSAVLRWLFEEEGFANILEIFRSSDKVVCSRLTLVECGRVLRRAVAAREITESEAGHLRGVLNRAASRWAILELSSEVASRAEQAFPAEPIQTLDALHLASALVLRNAIPNLDVVSTDERIRKNAIQLGFSVLPTST